MKYIVRDDLGLNSSLVQEQSLLTIDAHEKQHKRARKLLKGTVAREFLVSVFSSNCSFRPH
jgi:hypothetical protein